MNKGNFIITRKIENQGNGNIKSIIFGKFQDPMMLTMTDRDKSGDLQFRINPLRAGEMEVMIMVAPNQSSLHDVNGLQSSIRNTMQHPLGIVYDPLHDGNHGLMFETCGTEDEFIERLKTWLSNRAEWVEDISKLVEVPVTQTLPPTIPAPVLPFDRNGGNNGRDSKSR